MLGFGGTYLLEPFKPSTFSFSAIVGNHQLKQALLINLVDPKIGGVLIRGPKGTGKSLAVRALQTILPDVEVAKCRFSCSLTDPTNQCEECKANSQKGTLESETRPMRLVTLPLGATEDRVVGSLDLERAIKEGISALDPGILAEVNQGILYVDEINLLPDHLVDDLLDSAAFGWNYIERENISVSHPSRFVLIGSMNPEEGELRPQLLDRLALHISMENIQDRQARMEIIKRNIDFENNPSAFRKSWIERDNEIRQKIIHAKTILNDIEFPEKMIEIIAFLCGELGVDGYRPDIVIARSARALAALENNKQVKLDHLRAASFLALTHRTRQSGMKNPPTKEEIEEILLKSKKIGP